MADPVGATKFPVDQDKLTQFAKDACEKAFEGKGQTYEHSNTKGWNDVIIGTLLNSLTTTVPPNSYKFIVTSTIIQHELKKEAKEGEPVPPPTASRGMHTASGAFWNQEKDAIWSYKQSGADGDNQREFDVVLTVAWVAV